MSQRSLHGAVQFLCILIPQRAATISLSFASFVFNINGITQYHTLVADCFCSKICVWDSPV